MATMAPVVARVALHPRPRRRDAQEQDVAPLIRPPAVAVREAVARLVDEVVEAGAVAEA